MTTHPSDDAQRTTSHPGTAREVFAAFLRLGLTSFGGPVAHLGYFREAFVVRRRWLSDAAYADLIALCQFLPGPASSQVGMAIGLQRAGFLGLISAWVAFTLPSAALLVAFALGMDAVAGAGDGGWLLGLKAVIVAVVAQAVIGMAKTLAPDPKRATIAALAMIGVLSVPSVFAQVAVLLLAGAVGYLWLSDGDGGSRGAGSAGVEPAGASDVFRVPVSERIGMLFLVGFAVLLVGLPLLARGVGGDAVHLFDIFYRAGALVFGGGHVVLPLLEAETVQSGMVGSDAFLAGYAAAQAVPGPLFTFAAFLGTIASPGGLGGAAIALFAMFLPGALLTVGALPFWQSLQSMGTVRRALRGVNAGVVGILAAALYSPVFTEGVTGVPELVIAVLGYVALTQWRVPPWAVVLGAAGAGQLLFPAGSATPW